MPSTKTPAPGTNTAPERDNGVHEAVRRRDAFLRPDGTIQNFCDGPCTFRNVPGVE